MKRLLLAQLLLGLIPTVNAGIVYMVKHGPINLEVRCQDGMAEHQIWHMDKRGNVRTLNLKGHGNEYFKNPELIPSNIYKSVTGTLCSSRQLTEKEIEAYDKKFNEKES